MWFDKLAKMLMYNAHIRVLRSRFSTRKLDLVSKTKTFQSWGRLISRRMTRSSFMAWVILRMKTRKNKMIKTRTMRVIRSVTSFIRRNRVSGLSVLKTVIKNWKSVVHPLSRTFRLWKLRALLRIDLMTSWVFLFEVTRIHNVAESIIEDIKNAKYIMKQQALDFLDNCSDLVCETKLVNLNPAIRSGSMRAKAEILSGPLSQKIRKKRGRSDLVLILQKCLCLEACVFRLLRFFHLDVSSSNNVGIVSGINPEFRWIQKTIILRKIAAGEKVTHIPNLHDDHHINCLLSSICVWKEEALRRWQFTMCCADTRLATVVGKRFKDYDFPTHVGFEWISTALTRQCTDMSVRMATGIQRFWEFRSIGEDFKSVFLAIQRSYEETGAVVPDRTLVRHRMFLTSVLPETLNSRLVSLPEGGVSTLDAFGTEYKCKWCKKTYENSNLDVTNVMLVGTNMFCIKCLNWGWNAMERKRAQL